MKKVTIGILLVLAIVLGYLVFKQKNDLNRIQNEALYTQQKTIPDTEESSADTEIFKNHPGSIQSIKKDDESWILAVDLLSRNPNWIPGNDSTGGFFINQNPKIRSLTVDGSTKIYKCEISSVNGTFTPTSIQNNENFIAGIENIINKSKTDTGLLGSFGYTAYFDITDSNITAIYQQCLP